MILGDLFRRRNLAFENRLPSQVLAKTLGWDHNDHDWNPPVGWNVVHDLLWPRYKDDSTKRNRRKNSEHRVEDRGKIKMDRLNRGQKLVLDLLFVHLEFT